MDVPQIQAREMAVIRKPTWPAGRRPRGLPATFSNGLLLLALLAPITAAAEPSPRAAAKGPVTSSRSLAEDELRRARELMNRGDVTLALSAYTEAIRIDATLGPAYLELGGLRLRLNDAREAELLYTSASMIREVRGRALFARAQIRRSDGRRREALLDLEEAIALEPDPAALQTLAAWYVESKNWPAALGVWRKLARLRLDSGDAASLREAELSARALSVLAAEADPVTSLPDRPAWVRRALAHIARRPPSSATNQTK
jgi:tetratricopeptide (TPR) repeat protein